MKELIGIFLVGLFGFAIWKTRQVATTAPRCPTVDELEAINRDILEGKTDLVDAENLARSYDAIAGCDAASASIRATILAKKSTGTSTAVPTSTTKATLMPIDPHLLLASAIPLVGEVTDMTIDGLSAADADGALRMVVRDYANRAGMDWSDNDRLVVEPSLEKRILADFTAQGKYREGVTPMIGVTAYNQLRAQRVVADEIASAKAGTDKKLVPGTVDFGGST